MMGKKRYALYRGDEFVDVGTAEEIAERQGIRPESVKWMSTPSYHKRGGYGKLRSYKIVEEDL